MIATTKAKIFLADQRVSEKNNFFICQKISTNGQPSHGEMYLMNDYMLAGGQSMCLYAEEYSYIILLPIVGAISYKNTAGNESLIAAGQIQLVGVNNANSFEISNPFKNEQVNFLQICIRKHVTTQNPKPRICTYTINEFQNSLIQISPQYLDNVMLPFKISIGKFSARSETIYHPKATTRGEIFAFALEGAFEVEGRLLHARDGLALIDAVHIEMEALSNDAIILLIEILPE